MDKMEPTARMEKTELNYISLTATSKISEFPD